MVKLISAKEYEALKGYQETAHRVLAARRWFASFPFLNPLFAYLLGSGQDIQIAGRTVTLPVDSLEVARGEFELALDSYREEPRV